MKKNLRYVNNGELSEESAEYLRYKCEVALNIFQISWHLYKPKLKVNNIVQQIGTE